MEKGIRFFAAAPGRLRRELHRQGERIRLRSNGACVKRIESGGEKAMLRKLAYILVMFVLCQGIGMAEGQGDSENTYLSDGETAYRLTDGGLWKLDEAWQLSEKVCHTEADTAFVGEAGTILAVPTDGGYRFELLGGDVLFEVETDRSLRAFVATGDCLVALWRYRPEEIPSYSDGSEGPLTAYRSDGQEVYTPCYAAGAIALDADGNVLVAKYEANATPAILRWDTASGMVREVMEVDGATAMCAVQNQIAYVYRNGVYIADETGNTRLLGEAAQCAETGLFACGAQVAAYCLWGEPLLQTFDLSTPSAAALTLINCSDFNDDRMKQAISMLREKHPDVNVQFVDMEPEKLNTALMANEPGIDLLYMGNFDAVNYVNAGVVEDLNEHPEVLAQLDHWLDVSGATTWNGVRFGVLMDISVDVLQFNESLREHLPEGLDPERLTWTDLLAAGAQFQGDTNGDGRQDVWLWQGSRRFPAFLFQYIMSADDPDALSFDTEQFRELMTLYRQCVQSGAFADQSDCAPESAVFVTGMRSALETEPCLPLPELEVEGAPATTCFVMALGVNRGSTNKALALELLANYCSVEAQKCIVTGTADRAYFGLLRDSAVYEGYDRLSDSAKATVDASRALFERTRLKWYARDFNAYCGDQVEAYLDGRIELDELIRNLQQRKQMVLMG